MEVFVIQGEQPEKKTSVKKTSITVSGYALSSLFLGTSQWTKIDWRCLKLVYKRLEAFLFGGISSF